MRDEKVVLVESGDEEQIEETLAEGNVPRLCRTRSMLAMLPIFARSFTVDCLLCHQCHRQ